MLNRIEIVETVRHLMQPVETLKIVDIFQTLETKTVEIAKTMRHAKFETLIVVAIY